jgi:hypothetical protein
MLLRHVMRRAASRAARPAAAVPFRSLRHYGQRAPTSVATAFGSASASRRLVASVAAAAAATAAATVAYANTLAAADAAPTIEVEHVTLSDGRVLAYRSMGDPDGVPIICLHGMSSCHLTWIPKSGSFASLAPGVRIIAIDRPGYGGSSNPPAWCARAASLAFRLSPLSPLSRLSLASLASLSPLSPLPRLSPLSLASPQHAHAHVVGGGLLHDAPSHVPLLIGHLPFPSLPLPSLPSLSSLLSAATAMPTFAATWTSWRPRCSCPTFASRAIPPAGPTRSPRRRCCRSACSRALPYPPTRRTTTRAAPTPCAYPTAWRRTRRVASPGATPCKR